MATEPGRDPNFPAVRYSASGTKTVKSAEEEAALGDGWYDSPDKVGVVAEPDPEPKAKKKK